MDPAQEEKQEQKKGPISQGINFLNSIPVGGLNKSLAKIGSGVATRVGGFFAAISLEAWIVLGIIALLALIVFVIIVSGVAPGTPIEGVTPTPAP